MANCTKFHLQDNGGAERKKLAFVELLLDSRQVLSLLGELAGLYADTSEKDKRANDESRVVGHALKENNALILNPQYLDILDGEGHLLKELAKIIGNDNLQIYQEAVRTLLSGDDLSMYHLINIGYTIPREGGRYETEVQFDVEDNGNGFSDNVDLCNLLLTYFLEENLAPGVTPEIMYFEEVGAYSEGETFNFIEASTKDYSGLPFLVR